MLLNLTTITRPYSSNEEISCISNDPPKNDASVIGRKTNADADFGLLDEVGNDEVDKSDEWQQAETLMSEYKSMLEQREGLSYEVIDLERQNDKLEDELKARLQEDVNEDLAFPPSSMIRADEGAVE